jgi:hypothetical protein
VIGGGVLEGEILLQALVVVEDFVGSRVVVALNVGLAG